MHVYAFVCVHVFDRSDSDEVTAHRPLRRAGTRSDILSGYFTRGEGGEGRGGWGRGGCGRGEGWSR